MPDDTIAEPGLVADLRRQLAACGAELEQRTIARDQALAHCAERDEALAQQVASAEILQIINRSSGDLAPVFDAILERAMRLCGAVFGFLRTYDGEFLHTVAHRGAPAELADLVNRPPPGGLVARLLAGESSAQANELGELHPIGNPVRRPLVDLGGARTGLWWRCARARLFLAASGSKNTEFSTEIANLRVEINRLKRWRILYDDCSAQVGRMREERDTLAAELREARDDRDAHKQSLNVLGEANDTLINRVAELEAELADREDELKLYKGAAWRLAGRKEAPAPAHDFTNRGVQRIGRPVA